MPEPSPPAGDWYGFSAFITSLGALLGALLRGRRTARTIDVKIAVLETRYEEIERRLGNIEANQRSGLDKLDRLMERMPR